MLRHLPPAATPLTLADFRQGLRAPTTALPRFRAALAHYLGANDCALAASGRTAFYLLLRRLSAERPARQEVVLPAYTCPALVKVIVDAGLRPRLADISPHTLSFKLEHLSGHIYEDTLVVVCVHPFGIPQTIGPVVTLAHAAGAMVIEDAAQALGARIGGRPLGTQGDFGLFSLGPGKPLSTGGGGLVCAGNAASAQLLNEAWQGVVPASAGAAGWALARLALLALTFHPAGWWLATRAGLHHAGNLEASWGYRISSLTAPQAAVGLSLLARLDTINSRRYHNACELMDRLQAFDFIHTPPAAATAEPVYLRLPLIVDSEQRRERLLRRLWAAGIGAGRMYRNSLPELFPQLATRNYPGAAAVARRLLTLPTHHYLTPADLASIASIFQSEV